MAKYHIRTRDTKEYTLTTLNVEAKSDEDIVDKVTPIFQNQRVASIKIIKGEHFVGIVDRDAPGKLREDAEVDDLGGYHNP